MKLFHLSDLHLGRRLWEYSLLEDQRAILEQILDLVRDEGPDGVLIAGDVYDKPTPSAEAVALLDQFLTRLTALTPHVLLVSGNHDSPERLSFGARLMEHSGVHIAPVYGGEVRPVTLTDGHGPVDLWLLPYVKPVHVRRFFPEREIASFTDALGAAVEAMPVDPRRRNVLVTHQFVTGGARCESEELTVGGTDNVDAGVFAPFDYVALGHLHSPQKVGRETVRYCGSPLKYSLSETGQEKSVTVVELGEKGDVRVRTLPLVPMRDLVELRGSYDQVTFRPFYQGKGWQDDYVHITLTDEQDIPDGAARLRVIYHNLLGLNYDNQRTRAVPDLEAQAEERARRSPLELVEDFYHRQNGQSMEPHQRELARGLIEEIWGDGE